MVVSIPHGYKQTEVGTIPEDWEIVSLGDVVDFLDGQRRPIKSSDRERMKGIYPYYGASGIVDYVNDYIFDEELILLGEDGENILSRSLPLAFRAKGKIWVNNHAHVIRSRPEMHIGYLAEYLESLDYKLLNSGTAQPKLNKQTCLKIKVAKPTKTEQTAIAKALSDADTWIESLIRLIAKKRQIKQGATQRLLSAHENGVLKDGWVVKALGDVADILTGFPFPSSGYATQGIRLVRGSNIKRGETDWSEHICQYWPKVTMDIKKFELEAGDIVVAMDGSLVGRSFAQVKNDDLPSLLLQRVARIRPKSDKYDVNYIKEWVCSEIFTDHCDALKTVTAIPHISPADIDSFKLGFPAALEEQTRIASILSGMDTEITQLEIKLSKAKTLKQGMMQNLLTGKIRLVKPQEVNCADA